MDDVDVHMVIKEQPEEWENMIMRKVDVDVDTC